MGKRLIILFLVFSFCQATQAQQLTWSSTQRVKGNNYYSDIIGQNTKGVYVIRAKNNYIKRKFTIERYNNDLQIENSKNIKLKSERYVDAKVFNNLFYVFTSDVNPETGLLELKATVYNETLQPTGKTFIIDNAVLKNTFDKGDFKLILSPDGTKLATYHTEISNNDKLIISMRVLNTENLTGIGTKKVALQYNYNDYLVGAVKVANNGSLFFVGNARAEAERRRDDYVLHYIYCYNPTTDLLKDFLLGENGVYTTDVVLAHDMKHNRIVAVATIANSFSNTSKGIEVISISNDSFNMVYNNFIDYSYSLKSGILGENRAAKGSPLTNFKLTEVIIRSDGGAVVIAEKFYITTQTQTYFANGQPQTTTRSVYNYDDVFIISANPDGTVAWEQVINKSQSSVNDGGYYSSFITVTLNNEINIIFNDRLRGNGDVLQYTIASDGTMTNHILLRSDEHYVAVMPRETIQITKNTVVVSTSKNKRFSLLKLDYRY